MRRRVLCRSSVDVAGAIVFTVMGKPLAALKASDPKMARLIEATEPVDATEWRRARPLGNPFSVLVYSIIGQQISGFAARAIAGRLTGRFGDRMPSPAELLALDPGDLNSVRASQ